MADRARVGTGDEEAWTGKRLFLVGIKGTGMTALTELLLERGGHVSGSDTEEVFYTDAILAELGVPVVERFDAEALPEDTDLVVYSAAYDPAEHPQLREAASRGLPMLSYPAALGRLSESVPAVGIAGVHGKTTTTALTGCLVQSLGLSGSVVVGSAVKAFGGRSTHAGGDSFLVAETCEYRRHFHHFSPDLVVVTAVEQDHLDYFRDYDDIRDAFVEYGRRLPQNGALLYCADDPGAREVARILSGERPDLEMRSYGAEAAGTFRLLEVETGPGLTRFRLGGFPGGFELRIPGAYNALNATAALAVASWLSHRFTGEEIDYDRAARAISEFTGTKRRAELVGEAAGVLFVDDYGHHPTAIRKTLRALRDFYPGHRMIVDFMSHTYSRTAALKEEFARAFDVADIVILHKIYASAREQFSGSISGEELARAVSNHHGSVYFYEEVMDGFEPCLQLLRPGDLFVTMGAGSNWRLGHRLCDALGRREPAPHGLARRREAET